MTVCWGNVNFYVWKFTRNNNRSNNPVTWLRQGLIFQYITPRTRSSIFVNSSGVLMVMDCVLFCHPSCRDSIPRFSGERKTGVPLISLSLFRRTWEYVTLKGNDETVVSNTKAKGSLPNVCFKISRRIGKLSKIWQ